MIHSFLIIGQSNMAGRGFPGDVEPIQNDRLKVLRNGRWINMYTPVNPDRAFSGICLAESFADEYAKAKNVDVGIIPCADGGTSLNQWAADGLLFDHACYMAQLASRTSTIAGVLWHQGEGDCSPELYPLYEEKFTVIMNELRKRLNLYDVPFLLGGLGDFLPECTFSDKLKNYIHINDALKRIANHNEMTGFDSAEGLGSNPDKLHFSAKALREFGVRYYNEFAKLENKDKVFLEKPSMDDAFRTELERL